MAALPIPFILSPVLFEADSASRSPFPRSLVSATYLTTISATPTSGAPSGYGAARALARGIPARCSARKPPTPRPIALLLPGASFASSGRRRRERRRLLARRGLGTARVKRYHHVV